MFVYFSFITIRLNAQYCAKVLSHLFCSSYTTTKMQNVSSNLLQCASTHGNTEYQENTEFVKFKQA